MTEKKHEEVPCEACGNVVAVVRLGEKVKGMCKDCDPQGHGFITSTKDEDVTHRLAFHG